MVCILTYLIQRLGVMICLGEVSSAYLAPNHRAETFSRSSLTNTFFVEIFNPGSDTHIRKPDL